MASKGQADSTPISDRLAAPRQTPVSEKLLSLRTASTLLPPLDAHHPCCRQLLQSGCPAAALSKGWSGRTKERRRRSAALDLDPRDLSLRKLSSPLSPPHHAAEREDAEPYQADRTWRRHGRRRWIRIRHAYLDLDLPGDGRIELIETRAWRTKASGPPITLSR